MEAVSIDFYAKNNLFSYNLGMEKHKPHYRLVDIQTIVARDGLLAFTATALFNRLAMGLSDVGLLRRNIHRIGAIVWQRDREREQRKASFTNRDKPDKLTA